MDPPFYPQMLNGTWSGTCFLGCSSVFTGEFESDPSGNFKFSYLTCGGPKSTQGRIEIREGLIVAQDISPSDTYGILNIGTYSLALSSGNLSGAKIWNVTMSRAPPPPTPQPSDYLDELKEYLTDCDLSFLVDDSGSMQKPWDEAKEALKGIVKVVFDNDGTGIDIGFVNSDRGTKGLGRGQTATGGIKSGDQVMELFSQVEPKGTTEIDRRLEAILKPFLDDMDNARKKVNTMDEYAFENEKSLSVIIITDGKGSAGSFERLKNVITNAEQRLKAANPIRKHLHILFFQIGGHTKTALDELKDFQTGLVGIVPHERKLTADKILEVLSGRFVQASASPTPSPPDPISMADMQQKLSKYQTVILIDDSPSMLSSRNTLSESIAAIVDKAVKSYGVAGIDLRFIDNNSADGDGLKNGEDVRKHLVAAQPDESSEESLKDGLSAILNSFTAKWAQPNASNIKPINVILFTNVQRDGGTLNNNLSAMIQRIAEKLEHYHAPPSSVGVQFVVMGGTTVFQPLKKVNPVISTEVMVDTIEYDTQLTDRKLTKIFFGAIDSGVNSWRA